MSIKDIAIFLLIKKKKRKKNLPIVAVVGAPLFFK